MPRIKERKKKLKIRKNLMFSPKIWELAWRNAYDRDMSVSRYVGLLILKANNRNEEGKTFYMRRKERMMLENANEEEFDEEDIYLGDED